VLALSRLAMPEAGMAQVAIFGILAVVLAAVFLVVEQHSQNPLVPLNVVRKRSLSVANLLAGLSIAIACARPGGLPVEVLGDITTDERYRRDSLRLADLRASQGRSAYVYQLDWQAQAFDGLLGAPHCLELSFVFHNFDAWSDARMLEGTDSPKRQALADAMHAAWIAFVRTGDPNHDALPSWEPYRLERRNALRFDALIEPVDDVRGYWRRTWDRFGGRSR